MAMVICSSMRVVRACSPKHSGWILSAVFDGRSSLPPFVLSKTNSAPMTGWTEIFTQYVAPALVGGAAGLLSPWAAWGVEKRRGIRKRREELVDRWRAELLTDWDGTLNIGGQTTRYPFMDKPAYWSLREHLSKDFLNTLETGPPQIVVG